MQSGSKRFAAQRAISPSVADRCTDHNRDPRFSMKQTNESGSLVEAVSHERTGATGPDNPTGEGFTLRSFRDRAEIQAIQQALGYVGWNRTRAARLLEISYRSLLLKIQRHKITRQSQ